VPGIVTAVNGRKIAIALTDRSAWDFHPFTVKRWAAAAILFLVWVMSLSGSRTAVDLR
jgi:hypothetical protein